MTKVDLLVPTVIDRSLLQKIRSGTARRDDRASTLVTHAPESGGLLLTYRVVCVHTGQELGRLTPAGAAVSLSPRESRDRLAAITRTIRT